MEPTNRLLPTVTAVPSGALLEDFSRPFALEVYREWRERIASANRSDLEALAMLLIQKRSVDGYERRRWDSSAHLYFSDAVSSMMKKISSNILV